MDIMFPYHSKEQTGPNTNFCDFPSQYVAVYYNRTTIITIYIMVHDFQYNSFSTTPLGCLHLKTLLLSKATFIPGESGGTISGMYNGEPIVQYMQELYDIVFTGAHKPPTAVGSSWAPANI